MADQPTVDDMMVAYAQDAVDFAKANFGVELDYSEASVEAVEGILDKLHQTMPKGFLGKMFGKMFGKKPSFEQVEQMGKVLGGYVGEVMKQSWGGHWKLESAAFPGEQVVTLEVGGGDCWPHQKAGKRILNGPEDNVWHYFQIVKQRYVKA